MIMRITSVPHTAQIYPNYEMNSILIHISSRIFIRCESPIFSYLFFIRGFFFCFVFVYQVYGWGSINWEKKERKKERRKKKLNHKIWIKCFGHNLQICFVQMNYENSIITAIIDGINPAWSILYSLI